MALMKLRDELLKENLYGTDNTKIVMTVNIHYPTFEGGDNIICERLSNFYGSAAHGFLEHCKKRYAPSLKRAKNGKDIPRNGASMSWYVSFLNENVLSLLTDVSFFDGKVKRSRRLVHNWDIKGGCVPLRTVSVFTTSRRAKELYVAEICSRIGEGEGDFGYYKNARHLAKTHFSFEKFYFTPKGIAFYYDPNVLFASDSICPAFIIPFSEIEGMSDIYKNSK